MPLLCDEDTKYKGQAGQKQDIFPTSSHTKSIRKQSQHSIIAKTAILNQRGSTMSEDGRTSEHAQEIEGAAVHARIVNDTLKASQPSFRQHNSLGAASNHSLGAALTDTPATTAPNSPRIPPRRADSTGSSTPHRSRPTTLDIPGLTRSKVSPDGRIAQRDVGSKLVIVMVGLPARGKSYVTRKISRYLNWLQHDTRIFNVGERRRVAAGGNSRMPTPAKPTNGFPGGLDARQDTATSSLNSIVLQKPMASPATIATKILINGHSVDEEGFNNILPPPAVDTADPLDSEQQHPTTHQSHGLLHRRRSTEALRVETTQLPTPEPMEQTAEFFDPENTRAAQIREQVALETLDELLEFILEQGGSVGIFDATNSTLERRKMIMNRIRERAGPELNVLFLESLCVDQGLLESNMRLKLSGPDYKDQDPVTALDDFRKRVSQYEKVYVPLGEYEENNNMPYVQMIDVGRKVVSHQIRGFLSAQTVYYLLNFNLAPRQIWITRHGESLDNVKGRLGGDSDLSANGVAYAKALTEFIKHERQAWDVRQEHKARSTHFPPRPGDTTPPNPDYSSHVDDSSQGQKSFCVWTSMLKRSIQTAQYFDEEEFELKQWKMLDELNAGDMEGMTYEEIRTQHNDEYELRKRNKMAYRYPGAGGEGYLDIINRLRAVIVEVERMTDHVLLVGHRSVARVLLAYFKGLKREDVADLDVPLGMLYMLEPKPYGVDFKAYRFNPETSWFDHIPNYELRRATSHIN